MLHAAFFAIDIVSMFSAVLLAAGLLAAYPRRAAAHLAAYVCVLSAGFVVFSRALYSGWIPEPFRFAPGEPVILVLQILMNTTPGAFMLLCFRLFDESGRRIPRWLLVSFAFQVALEDLVPYLFGITTHPSLVPTMTDANVALYITFEALPAALQALFVGVALYWTVKDWRADLVEARRLLRAVLMVVIGVNMVSFTLLTRLFLDASSIRMLYVHEAYMAFNALTNVAVIVYLLRLHAAPQSTPSAIRDGPASGADPTVDLDYAAFETAMKAQVYREAGLSIATLAARLGIPEYRLRRLINTKLGYRNFNHMLHAYRIAEATTALADPSQRRLPILTIALSVGYQSINPFNRAVRDLKGTTPSAFRQQALAQTPADHTDS